PRADLLAACIRPLALLATSAVGPHPRAGALAVVVRAGDARRAMLAPDRERAVKLALHVVCLVEHERSGLPDPACTAPRAAHERFLDAHRVLGAGESLAVELAAAIALARDHRAIAVEDPVHAVP